MPKSKNESSSSLLHYYQDYGFNPVPIAIEKNGVWESHIIKRRNLYERHLMIPLSFFRGRFILEFGCNSGENALYLASLGARLTLVEPNSNVLPRLRMLFKDFGHEKAITDLINTDIAGFDSRRCYDVLIAECFINTLADKDEMFLKICSFLTPGGVGIISFDDRYGSLLEVTRQLLLRRACQLKGIDNMDSEESLRLAKVLYSEDFAQINASRPFEAWWRDALINPFVAWKHFWTYQTFIPLLEKADCEFYSSSPKWTLIDGFSWYKNVSYGKKRHKRLLSDWYRAFPFFLTGLPLSDPKPATSEVVETVSDLIDRMSNYIASHDASIDSISYPSQLDNYLNKSKERNLSGFNEEMKRLFDAVKSGQLKELISSYREARCVRKLWGTPCHYISFIKQS